jgi:hypothetical protein
MTLFLSLVGMSIPNIPACAVRYFTYNPSVARNLIHRDKARMLAILWTSICIQRIFINARIHLLPSIGASYESITIEDVGDVTQPRGNG